VKLKPISKRRWKRNPELSVSSLSVVSAKVPDLALYESARSLYLGYMENYRASVEPALTRASSQAAEEQVRMEILRRYGDLLERYPDLIDYLAIEAGLAPRQRAVVQTFLPPTAVPTVAAPAYAFPPPPATLAPAPAQSPAVAPEPSTAGQDENPEAARP
jgi:hypothetical protein